jgi:hypothetical protein
VHEIIQILFWSSKGSTILAEFQGRLTLKDYWKVLSVKGGGMHLEKGMMGVKVYSKGQAE